MSVEKNILLVSIAFPPKNDPECIQTGKYFKYLLKAGWDVSVVSSSIPTLHMPFDEELQELSAGAEQLIEIPITENKYLNYFWRKTGLRNLEQPDSKVAFARFPEKVIRELKNPPKLIYSRSFPISSTLLAEKLVDHYEVPWVLHLSDPWTLSPIHHFEGDLKRFHQDTERRVFEKASLICFSSEATVQAYRKCYPEFAMKFGYFPNVYDPESLSREAHRSGKLLQITYTGGLAGSRSPEPIIRAFQELYEQEPNDFKQVRLNFVGSFDRKNRKILNESGLPFLTNQGLVSFGRSLEFQREAELLLLIDTPVNSSENSLFFPSKFLDYLQSGRKIIALTYKGSPIDQIMTEEHGFKAYYGNETQLSSIISSCIHSFKYSESGVFDQNASLPAEFSADYQARKLSSEFKRLIADSSGKAADR